MIPAETLKEWAEHGITLDWEGQETWALRHNGKVAGRWAQRPYNVPEIIEEAQKIIKGE